MQPISAVELEYSLWSRDIEDDVLPTVRELGIGILAYSALSRGLLTGTITVENPVEATDFRAHFPRFQRENLEANLRLVDHLRSIAMNRVVTVSQVAIAWVLQRGEALGNDIVPVVGTKRRRYLTENPGGDEYSTDGKRSFKQSKRRFRGDAAAGERYPAPAMQASEPMTLRLLSGRPGSRPAVPVR